MKTGVERKAQRRLRLTACLWQLNVLGDARAVSLSLKISGLGERLFTGAEAYSLNRPFPAGRR
jgi:hypothetical protein